MNSWSGIGNLTRDPESSATQSGLEVSKFTLAINRPKDQNGQSQADFIPIRALGKRAQLCNQYLKKGRKIGVVGKLQTYSYTGQDGQKKYGFEILLDDITFLSSSTESKPAEESATAEGQQQSQSAAPAAPAAPAAQYGGYVEVDEEELPF